LSRGNFGDGGTARCLANRCFISATFFKFSLSICGKPLYNVIDETIKMLNEIAIDDRKGITTETFTHYPQYGIDYWTVTYKAQ
jgi:hypothetical protein